MKAADEIVNFIRENGKIQQWIRNFIKELELEDKPSDVSFYSSVRLLSTSNVLIRFVDLLKLISFLKKKKRNSNLNWTYGYTESSTNFLVSTPWEKLRLFLILLKQFSAFRTE